MSTENMLDQVADKDPGLLASTNSTIPAQCGSGQPSPSADRIQLSDGYSVTPEFLSAIRLHIDGRLPALQRDRRYTAMTLAGEDFWEPLDNGERRMSGRCLAYLVARRELPLVFVEGKHEYPLHYQLK